jgi:hypothetical protein
VLYRYARPIGMAIAGVGLAVLIGFGSVTVLTAGDFHKAQMVRERNPGNAMYDLQFFIASTRLAFLISGAVGGGLLALNGATLFALGTAVRRHQHGPAGILWS